MFDNEKWVLKIRVINNLDLYECQYFLLLNIPYQIF